MPRERKRIAIYPGTFDPITNGHADIVKRAIGLFDKVIIAVGENPHKKTLFSQFERAELVKKVLSAEGLLSKDVTVDCFEGLLAKYARKVGACAIIRGLRAVSDFEYEFQMALANRKLLTGAETVFLMPSEPYVYLNSTMVKDIAFLGGDISQFVHKIVEKKLIEKVKQATDAEKNRTGGRFFGGA